MAQTHLTVCNLCEACCGIAVEVAGDRITAIRGDGDDPLSRGHVCPKVMGLKDVHEDPDRLKQPVERTGSGWRVIGWGEAFDKVAAGLAAVRARHGRHAIAIYQGNPTVHSLGAMTFGPLFFRSVRTRNRYSATSVDQLPHMLAALLMYGHQLAMPVPDIDRTNYLLVLGANPLVSNGSIMTAPDMKRRLRAIRERGGNVVVVDPRRTETARCADEHLFIRPGTDALFLLALVHTIFAEGLVNLGRLEPLTRGVEALRDAAAPFAPREVAPVTGIDAGAIRRIAREFAAAPSAVCYGRVGVSTQEFGGLCAWLVNAVNIVTGNLDRPGGAMFASPSFDLLRAFTQRGMRGSFDRFRSRVRGLPEFGGELPASALAEEIDTPGPDQVRALITSAGNPVLSLPNGGRLERALATLEFMVSIDIYANETTRHANIILPPTSALERDHFNIVFGQLAVRNFAKYAAPVFPRRPEQRHDWEIFLELWKRLRAPQSPMGKVWGAALQRLGAAVGPRAIVNLGLLTGPYRMTLRALERQPHGVDLGPLKPRLPELLHTEDPRINLAPSQLIADLARLRRGARRGERSGLELIGRRQLRSNNSWMHNAPRLVKGRPRCTLLMHPADASRLGLADCVTVRVRSRVGEVVVPLEITDDVMPGVVSLPHGWGHDRDGVRLSVAVAHAGASINDLTDEMTYDELSGNACFSGVPVEVLAERGSECRDRL